MSERTETEIIADYEKAFTWRDLWNRLSNRKPKSERGRLQSRHDRIERRAMIANNRIAYLMREIDAIRTARPDTTMSEICNNCGQPESEHGHLGMPDMPICTSFTARPDDVPERDEEIAELQSAYDHSVQKRHEPKGDSEYRRLKDAAWKELTDHRTTSIAHPYFSQGFAAAYSLLQAERTRREQTVQEILELVEKKRKECDWSNFESDDTPWGGFEWACEQIYEEIEDQFVKDAQDSATREDADQTERPLP
jgi:hypothetical protein